jgi:hypothetical protein
MAGSLAAIITIPIVVAIALFTWIAAVLYANRHPRWAHHEAQQAQPLATEVRGGAFRAVEGGRQLMPIPERRPAGVPGPRTAVATETYQPSGAHPSGTRSGATPSGRAGQQSAPAREASAEETGRDRSAR